MEDLDLLVGEKALGSSEYVATYPVEHGIVRDWNSMEHLYAHAVYEELRCCPEEHLFLVTEPFNNTPVSACKCVEE